MERKSDVRFYSAAFFNNRTQKEDEIYVVGFPEGSGYIENLKILVQNGKIEAYFDELTETHYYRITEEQYDQLTKDFFRSREKAGEDIKKVTFLFDELFGEFLSSSKM